MAKYLSIVCALLMALPTMAFAQNANRNAAQASHSDADGQDGGSAAKIKDADIATAPVRELKQVTHHSAVIAGHPLGYTATAGTLTIRNDDGKPTASMFYVAYTTDTKNDHRPVTFFYNGGPGSSSLYLHMGSLGPRRLVTDSPAATYAAPYQMVDNNESLLDKSDLIFLDAIGTGYSRPLGDTKIKEFWGTDEDIDAFAKAIERYLTINDRWNSPKFLFGESYGTPRSAGLSYRLQQDGAQLNGVMLLSSILNFGISSPSTDRNYVNNIPSYAATAVYHKKVPAPKDMDAFLHEVRAWAAGPYSQALSQGQTLPDAQRAAIAQQMSAYIGLSAQFLLNADLRVDLGRFRSELLRDQHLIIGRYDGRFTGFDVDAASENATYDPSDTGINGVFVSTLHDYLSRELGFTSELIYRPGFHPNGLNWDFQHHPPRGGTNNTDMVLDLSEAMRRNPHLMVYSLNGIYDFATPFFGTEFDLAHMQLDQSLQHNLKFAYYPSGHMVYLNTDALKSMKADVARFYDEAAPQH